MKTSSSTPTSIISALRQNLTPINALATRTAALSDRILIPTPAAGEVLLVSLVIGLGLCLGLATRPAHAAESSQPWPDAAAIILQAHAFVASAPSFEMEQIKVDKITRQQAGQPVGPATTQTQTSLVRVVNGNPMVVELTTTYAGCPLRAIRRGDRVVMQLGSAPWQVPSGPYAQLKDQLAAPFACPLPGKGSDSPQWRMVGTAREQDAECDIVETVGDSTLAYVTGIMNKSMAAVPAAQRPSFHVVTYQARHWVARPDARRLRVEQTAQMQMTLRPPSGEPVQADVATTTTTVYRHYGTATVEIPAEAAQLLAAPAPQS